MKSQSCSLARTDRRNCSTAFATWKSDCHSKFTHPGRGSLKKVTDFPHEIIEQADVRIPMPDGIELSARIWRPRDERPVPAIVEYIPYRKRFGSTARDEIMHPWLAGH